MIGLKFAQNTYPSVPATRLRDAQIVHRHHPLSKPKRAPATAILFGGFSALISSPQLLNERYNYVYFNNELTLTYHDCTPYYMVVNTWITEKSLCAVRGRQRLEEIDVYYKP